MDGQVKTPTYVGRDAAALSVLRMLELCGVCSTDHVARLYAHTTRPAHRAWTLLEHLRQRGYVESWRPVLNRPAVHRLTRQIRKQYDLPLIRFGGYVWHRVAVTDVYVDLDMPKDFVTEPRAEYKVSGHVHSLCPDVYTNGMLIEVQRTHITRERWAKKRRQYQQFFASGAWTHYFETKPPVVVVQSHDQQLDTIGAGIFYDLYVVKNIREVYDLGILYDDREVHRQSSRQADRR